MMVKNKLSLLFFNLLFTSTFLIPIIAHATPLPCEQVVSATTSSSAQVDSYTFTAAAGDTVRIVATKVSGSTYFGPAMALYDPSGTVIASAGLGLSSTTIEKALTASGDYTVRVYDYNYDATGTYQVRWDKLNNPCGGKVTLPCGQSVSATTSSSAQEDYYTFTAAAGDTVRIVAAKVSGSTYFGPAMALYDPSGTVIASAGLGLTSATIGKALTVSGDYTVRVYDYNYDATGSYSLIKTNLNNICNAVSISCGQTLSRSLNSMVEHDFYSFTANAGDAIAFTMTVTSGSINPQLELFDYSGTKLTGIYSLGTGSVTLNYVISQAGTYSIAATDYNYDEIGSYKAKLQKNDNSCPEVQVLSPNGGQLIYTGSPYTITWTATARAGLASEDISLSTDSGVTYPIVIVQGLPGTVTSYAWTPSNNTVTGRIRISVTDNAGLSVADASDADFTVLSIQNMAVSEGYISPNGDGVKDSTVISATITQLSNWTVTIKDSSANVIRTYSGLSSSITQTWDGKNSAGAVVPDGTYTCQIVVGDAVAPTTGTIVVDTDSPLAQITTPGPNTVLRDTVQIMGTATDMNLDYYRLEYGPSGNGPWSFISSASLPVNSDSLANWVTNDQTNAVPIQNGSYLVRLMVADKAGNSSTVTVPVSTDNLILSNISASSNMINTMASETSSIFFTINEPATATLKIIPEMQGPTGVPVYQTSQVCSAAGAYVFTWNGTDNTGKVVPDEAYLYVIEATDGNKSDSYYPPAPTGTGTVTCSQSSDFDPLSNNPMTVTYTPSLPSRVTVSISWGAQNFDILTAFATMPGSHSYIWDVRNPSGKPLNFGAQSSCSVASLLRENYLITTGDTPAAGALKTDPYAMSLSYGQFTRIKYTLSRDSNVTLQLVSPSGSTRTLVNNQLQTTGPQELNWYGMDPADTTGKKALVSEEGDYMVTVQTVNPVTGTSSTARGNLRIRK